MEKDTTYVALDDSKRKIVAGILRSGDVQPELREIANDARQIRRLFERLKREGPVAACYEAGVSGYDLYRQITGLGVAWLMGAISTDDTTGWPRWVRKNRATPPSCCNGGT
jgi:transposase